MSQLLYLPRLCGTHCAYPGKDGQAELTRVARNIPVLTRLDVEWRRWSRSERYR